MNIADRLRQLFAHLGIEQAHFLGGAHYDPLGDVCTSAPDLAASMTHVCPMSVPTTVADDLTIPFTIITGDAGKMVDSVTNALRGVDRGHHITLKDYAPKIWDDIARERKDEIGDGILNFLATVDEQSSVTAIHPSDEAGTIAELVYRTVGDGPPLVVFPLGLSPSQWDPLLDVLSARYCVVLISGGHMPPMSNHETRIRNPGWMEIVVTLLDAMTIDPRDRILEVGCGTGAVTRVIAEYTERNNAITGIDINAFLRKEAELLRDAAGFEDVVTYEDGDALSLPIADEAFDVTLSVTMLEEVNADRAIAEMVRVTLSGGRVGAIVRSIDMAPLVSAELPENIVTKVGAGILAAGADPEGCADVSIYRRFAQAGLTDLKMYPRFNTTAHLFARGPATALLSSEELAIFNTAATGAGEGFFVSMPMHVAVGTKP